MHFMFCVSGFSGTGKDEFCRRLVEKHSAVHTGLADPAKRHMADVYGFSRDQLFGPSHMRNAGDPRYPKTFLTESGARPAEGSELLLDTSEDSYTDPEKTWWCADFTSRDQLNQEAGPMHDLTIVWNAEQSTVLSGSSPIPSKNLGHMRVRAFFEGTDPRFFLSPREALQKYCDLLNRMYLCTWVRAGVDLHRKLAMLRDAIIRDNQVSSPLYAYDRMSGLMPNEFKTAIDGLEIDFCRPATRDVVTCFSDFRHKHEIKYVREAEHGLVEGERGYFKVVLIRVKRPGVEIPPFNHRSETEQATIPDSEFDYVVDNNDTVEGLHAVADTIVEQVKASCG